jgi:riboflavin kinase / FMN adenylyltransferase
MPHATAISRDMDIIRGNQDLLANAERLKGAVLAMGNFDGVHKGHQTLLSTAKRIANEGQCGVLTFDPHPARFFAPSLAPPMIMPLEVRLQTLASYGMNFTFVEHFNAALAALSPEEFVTDYLHARLGVAHVVVGYDFAFGKGRKGTTSDLVRLCEAVGMGVEVVPPVAVEGLVCSSTKIREFILEGRVEGAERLLGRPFAVQGEVVKGAQRGRLLGYPTANVAAETELLPRPAIYAAFAQVPQNGKIIQVDAAVSVGTNPTFQSNGTLSIEAHLLDFQGDLYGERLRIDFIARLRDEQRFENIEALIAAIENDVNQTRDILSKHPAKL